MADVVELRPMRVYFKTSSTEGFTTADVEHVWSTEHLSVPLYPPNSLPDVLPLLEPAFSHYLAQWEKYMVPNVNETDARGFWVPSGSMPQHIAPLEHWEAICEIAWSHMPDSLKQWLGHWRPDFIGTSDPQFVMHSNIDDVVGDPEEFGIELWQG